MKKCINRRCSFPLEDNYKYCPMCGKIQERQKEVKRRRAKGTGSIYFRKDKKTKPWCASINSDRKTEYIGCFATRAEAEAAILTYKPGQNSVPTLEKLYADWIETKPYQKLSDSSKSGYSAAWIKLRYLYSKPFNTLKTSDFQAVIDYYENPHHEEGKDGGYKYIDKSGKVTMNPHAGKPKICEGLGYSALHNIKCLVSKLCQFAMKDDIINKNYGQLLDLPSPEETKATRFTDIQLETIRQKMNGIPYCDYIYALCYLNFRISEFLELTAESYGVSKSKDTGIAIPYLIGGKKTKAGRNRPIPIHPNVQEIVKRNVDFGGETIFCRADGTPMDKDYFNKYCFKPAMEALGFDGLGFTPHSCRRTFSTRMSAGGARAEDIAALMGHADFEVDKKHYINQELKTLYEAIQKMA